MTIPRFTAFVLSLIGPFSVQAIPINLIKNGGFEEPVVLSGSYAYRTGAELNEWVVVSSHNGVVQFDHDYRPVGRGDYSVQIESGNNGFTLGDTLSQSFSTVANSIYSLSFDLSAYDSGGALLGITVGDLATSAVGFSSEYTTHSYTFQALGPVSTLTFQNLGSYAVSYPHLDNVSVIAVSVPDGGATMCLLSMSFIGLTILRGKSGRQYPLSIE